MIEKVSKRSGELFQSGFYCAESVVLAITEGKGLHSDLIPRMATGFCSGLSRTCGHQPVSRQEFKKGFCGSCLYKSQKAS